MRNLKPHRAFRLFSLLFFFTSSVFTSSAVCAAAMAPEGTPMRKLERGATNIALSPIELVNAFVRQRPEEHVPPNWAVGIFYGSIFMVERIGVGVYEVVTFPMALPKNYKPILQPEFEWGHFV
ncbi:MAG: exosortase system-associated protein, TIGR04073 family [Candidatus Omnitrophica bacterium]|nr:exosortase system-associated protein, TIGR04073 family [Candidatus Omnitrophota bacterium]